MSSHLPRTAAIHDLAGFGRCSLTVILPVLSTMGVQVCPVPTALLSTHSGGFSGFSFHDLTDDMEAFRSHWAALGLDFDCLYSGFLGSERQINLVLSFFRTFRKKSGRQILVDPVMGDNGKRYSTYTDGMQNRMHALVSEADIVTPNLTEICYLLDEPYPGEKVPIETARAFLHRLSVMGPRISILTGLAMTETQGYNLAYDADNNQCWQVPYELVPVHYPGTGDLFASAFLGCLLQGDPLPDALDKATQYLSLTIAETFRHNSPTREGVLFENTLAFLTRPLTQHTCLSC